MPAGAAGSDIDARGEANSIVVDLHLAEIDFARVERNAAQRSVGNGARLLPDLLQHEVLVAALFRLDGIPENARDVAMDGLAVEIGKLHSRQRQDGHVPVGKKINVAGVMKDAGDIGGNERFAFAHADHNRRPKASGNNLVGLAGRENSQRKRATQPLHGQAHSRFEENWLSGRFGFLLHLFDQVRNDLGVGFGDEDVALLGEFPLQVKVILDDAVMHHDNAAGAVAMWMCVLFGGSPVGGPACVADAEGALDRMLAKHFFQVRQLARRAPNLKHGAVGIADCNPRRIVAAIFEPPQAFDDDGDDFLWTHIADDAAHKAIVVVSDRQSVI